MAAGANRRVCGVARLPRASPSAHLAGTTEEGRRTSWTTGPRISIRTHGSAATSRRSSCGTSRSNARGSAGGWRPRAAATASGARARRSPSAPRCSPRRSCPRSRAARAAGARRAASGQGGRADAPVDTSSLAAATGGRTQLLRFGDVGPAVTAIQRQVGVTADGIFGPITRGAVERFQRDHGLGDDRDRRRAHVGGAVQRTGALLRRSGVRAAAARPAAAPRASVRLVVDRGGSAGRGVAGRDGRGVARARATAARLPGLGVVGVRPARDRRSRGPARAGSAPQSSAPAPTKHAPPAPKQTTPAPGPADHVGGRLHLGADRLAGERRDADAAASASPARGTCTRATTSPWRAGRRSTRRSAARSCSPAPSRATA